jgi:xylan 1,4-beta-xylosidase
MKIELFCDLSGKRIPLEHFWEYCVGSDHAPVALRSDWQKQLTVCHRQLGFQRVRFHGLLSDDVGTLMCEIGQLHYSFFNVDQIFDFLVSIGMHPFVEFSFMPTALASGNTTVFHYRGNVTPPRDCKAWATLVRKLVKHWLERYGPAEMKRWNFEVWNEPNLKAFWTGSQKDYFKFYGETARAIKSVEASLQVGGPATAKNEWIDDFHDYCIRHHVPLDFISTHHYPTDAFGSPQDATEMQLSKSRRGALRDQALDAKRQARGLPLLYTEWNSSSNPFDTLHDQSYSAAFAIKSVMDVAGVADAYSFWTFSDIFEENYFSSVPFHGGFGLLNIHGIGKPVYRAFQILHQLGNRRILVDGIHDTVNAWAILKNKSLTILVTNHALPGHSIDSKRLSISLLHTLRPFSAHIERIDDDHANPRQKWIDMRSPHSLSPAQVERLEKSSQLKREKQRFEYHDSRITFEIHLRPHSIAAVEFQFAHSPGSGK